MATPEDNIKKVKEELKGFNNEAASLVAVLQELALSLKQNADAAGEFTQEAATSFKEDAKNAVDLAKELQGYTLQQLKDKRSLNAFNKKIEKTENDRARTQSRINALEQRLVTAKSKEASLIKKSLSDLAAQEEYINDTLKAADGLKNKLEDINKQSGFFDNLSELVGDVPILNKVFKEFGNASKKAREAAAEGGNAFKEGGKELGKAAAKAIKAFTITTLRKGLISADERAVSLGRNLNMTTEAARQTVRQFNRFSESTKGLTGADLQGALTNISDAFGVTANLSNESAASLATMTKYLGMSAEESAKLAKFSATTGQEVEDVTQNLVGEVQILNARNKTGIKYQSVLKDVAGSSDAVKLSTKGSGQNLNKAAFEAKRLGLNLSQVDSIAGSLLNFEESISSELEAELLTGKDLNLEAARRAALNNDLEGVATEIAKQMGSAAEFGKMNRIQQEAMAKAVGMTRDELAASLAEREAIQKFGVSNKMALDAELATELKKIDALKAQGKFDEATAARKALIAKTGSEELIRQRENRTLAETQAEAMEKLGQAADAFLGIMDAIKGIFDKIASLARTIMKFFTAFTISGNGLSKTFGKVKNIMGGIAKTMKSITSLGGKMAKVLGIGGKAAANTTKAGASTIAGKAGGGSTKAAAKGGGGLFSKVGGFFSKMNPLKKAGALLKKGAGKLLKIPFLSAIIEGIFAGQDIQNAIATGKSKSDIYQAIGKRSWEAIGAIGGTAMGGILGSALGPVGTLAGGILGDTAGRWVAGKLASFGAKGFGEFVSNTFGYEDSINSGVKDGKIQAEDFTIQTHPKDTLVMAGGTKFGDETNALLRELIAAVKSSGNINLDGRNLNTAMQTSGVAFG